MVKHSISTNTGGNAQKKKETWCKGDFFRFYYKYLFISICANRDGFFEKKIYKNWKKIQNNKSKLNFSDIILYVRCKQKYLQSHSPIAFYNNTISSCKRHRLNCVDFCFMSQLSLKLISSFFALSIR